MVIKESMGEEKKNVKSGHEDPAAQVKEDGLGVETDSGAGQAHPDEVRGASTKSKKETQAIIPKKRKERTSMMTSSWYWKQPRSKKVNKTHLTILDRVISTMRTHLNI